METQHHLLLSLFLFAPWLVMVKMFDQPPCPSLHAPTWGERKCVWTPTVKWCLAQCSPEYRFPNNEKKILLKCKNNRWTPMATFPDCVPIVPIRKDACLHPSGPNQGGLECKTVGVERECQAYCHSTFAFPGGQTQITLKCNLKENRWRPASSFPQCRTTLPPLNPDDCPRPPNPENGFLSCERNETTKNCIAKCNSGYSFGPKEIIYTCDSKDKRWNPRMYYPACKRAGKKKKRSVIELFPAPQQDVNLQSSVEDLSPQLFSWTIYDSEEMEEGEYRGNQTVDKRDAQENAESDELCPIIKPPVAGKVNCSGNAVIKVCIGICHKGYLFSDNTTAKGAFCTRRKKIWTPISSFPPCEPTVEEARRVFEQHEQANYGKKPVAMLKGM